MMEIFKRFTNTRTNVQCKLQPTKSSTLQLQDALLLVQPSLTSLSSTVRYYLFIPTTDKQLLKWQWILFDYLGWVVDKYWTPS